jgi:hypothetical protein
MLVGATDSWPTVVVPENESRVAEKVKLGNIKEAKRRREIVWARMPYPTHNRILARYHLVTLCSAYRAGGFGCASALAISVWQRRTECSYD